VPPKKTLKACATLDLASFCNLNEEEDFELLAKMLGPKQEGLSFAIAHVLPVFKDLMDDSEPDVRANCALVLPRMISLAGSTFANLVFEDLFFSVLSEKNPVVIEKFLQEIHLGIKVLKQKIAQTLDENNAQNLTKIKQKFKKTFQDKWRRLFAVASLRWRSFSLYIDQTSKHVKYLRPCVK
jgi:hypothetical protein